MFSPGAVIGFAHPPAGTSITASIAASNRPLTTATYLGIAAGTTPYRREASQVTMPSAMAVA
jgi:hypothetical protein